MKIVIVIFFILVLLDIALFCISNYVVIPLCKRLFSTIKVDYSEDAKRNLQTNEFAVYTRKWFWCSWKEEKTYSDIGYARKYASELLEKKNIWPKYY